MPPLPSTYHQTSTLRRPPIGRALPTPHSRAPAIQPTAFCTPFPIAHRQFSTIHFHCATPAASHFALHPLSPPQQLCTLFSQASPLSRARARAVRGQCAGFGVGVCLGNACGDGGVGVGASVRAGLCDQSVCHCQRLSGCAVEWLGGRLSGWAAATLQLPTASGQSVALLASG